MGNSTSKPQNRDSTNSTTPLAGVHIPTSPTTPTPGDSPEFPYTDKTPGSSPLIYIDPGTPTPAAKRGPVNASTDAICEGITRIPPRPQITRYSSLIDPNDLILSNDWVVKSPSGNLLGPDGYFRHPDRPLSIRERQEKVVAALRAASNDPEINGTAFQKHESSEKSTREKTDGQLTQEVKRRSGCWFGSCCGRRK